MTCDGCPESWLCPDCGARFNVRADRDLHAFWNHDRQEGHVDTTTPYAMTYCPDCDTWLASTLFVVHREQVHPPQAITLSAAGGITSGERFGYQDD